MNYSDIEAKQIDIVFVLKNEERYKEAIEILQPIAHKYSEDRALNGVLAALYFGDKNYAESITCFTKAVSLNEHSELASLGLFHSLMNLGETKAALEEFKRFVSTNSYNNYEITIDELNECIDDFDDDERILIKNISQIMNKG